MRCQINGRDCLAMQTHIFLYLFVKSVYYSPLSLHWSLTELVPRGVRNKGVCHVTQYPYHTAHSPGKLLGASRAL